MKCSNLTYGLKSSRIRMYEGTTNSIKRRDLIGLVLGISSLFLDSSDVKAAGLPPEQKPRLCDDACEKELENVW